MDRPAMLLVEDEPELADMLVEVLSENYEVDVARTLSAARDFALGRRYSALVVDRRLPDGDGVELIRGLRRARIRTPAILLTALGTVDDKVTGLDAGANDYLVKPFDFEELLARLRALIRGFAADGMRREIGSWTYLPESATVHGPGGERASLTPAENALLELLSESPGRVLSREEIRHAVFDEGDTDGLVDTYVSYVRRKTSRELIETVRGSGYRLGEPT